MKKNLKKLLLAVCCAALLVCVSIGATVAYLTSNDKVENTFTVGSVGITLDETKVNSDGTEVTGADRVKANSYKLMPGHEYIKDPTVHVAANSEDSWIFVKVENGISAYEAATSTEEGGYKEIAEQITANSWALVDGQTNVYYKTYDQSTTVTNLPVFGNFKIADEANKVENWSSLNNAKVTVTAYAIQKDGFNTAAAAWAEVGK